jgi:mannose-6-phosphate isomerase-like protein (cupin superfamily)
MNRIFKITQGFKVPDETIVYPFLNSKDSQSDLPWDLTSDFSIAAGNIEPNTASKIQVHPVVTLVIWVVYGQLQVQMKDAEASSPYSLDVLAEQAALARPGTFLQLINMTASPCRVLYIVGPPYTFDQDHDGKVRYEDAVVLDDTWEQLEAQAWKPPELAQRLDPAWARVAREQALERIRMKKKNSALSENRSG